mmetsp:Transcript_25075/g.37500  ORF Transcript_25075/g.37500 Transcript_25075/m.37500 type:complete len:560 (-) Transcript_25075:210-1889(-)
MDKKMDNQSNTIVVDDCNSKKGDEINININIIDDEQKNQIKMKEKKEKKEQKKQAKEQRILRRQQRLSEWPSNTFFGKHKWLGGAVDPITGKIYGIPAHSYQVICITPSSSSSSSSPTETEASSKAEISTIPLPNKYQQGKYKWLRGLIYNGHLYGIPAWNVQGILKMNLSSNKITVLPLPHEPSYYKTEPEPVLKSEPEPMEELSAVPLLERENESTSSASTSMHTQKETSQNCTNSNNDSSSRRRNYSNVDRGRWMWHGGTVGKSSVDDKGHTTAAIYCVPSNAQHVLKVSLDDGSDHVCEIGPPLSEGQNKWYGGILGLDGCIYGMPYTATGVLRIDPKTDTVQVLSNFPAGGYKWHGGLLARSTGVIYAFPAHSNEVLCVDTNIRSKDGDKTSDTDDHDDESWRVSTIPIHRHENDTDPDDLQYKWLGGSVGADGCIYGMPSDATTILRIDPIKNQATTFGSVSKTINKWQGGVLSNVDNCVYAVPADMDCVLKIDTDPNTPLSIDLIGEGFQEIDDKWQGGFVASDNKIYAIPENINNVMVITPGEKPSVEMLQ